MPHLHMPAATMPIHPPRPAVRLPRHPAAAPTARLPHRSPPYPTTRCASPPGCLAARLSLCPPRLPPGAPTNPRRISFCIPGAALPLPCKQIVFPGPSSLCHAGKDLSPPRGFRFPQSPRWGHRVPLSLPQGATGFPCLCRRGPPGSPASAAGVPVSPVSAAAGLSVSPVSAAGGHRVPLPPPGASSFPQSPPRGATGFPCLCRRGPPGSPVSAAGGALRRPGMARFYRFDALAN